MCLDKCVTFRSTQQLSNINLMRYWCFGELLERSTVLEQNPVTYLQTIPCRLADEKGSCLSSVTGEPGLFNLVVFYMSFQMTLQFFLLKYKSNAFLHRKFRNFQRAKEENKKYLRDLHLLLIKPALF